MLIYRLESTIDDKNDNIYYNKLFCFDSITGKLNVKECVPFSNNNNSDEEIFEKFCIKPKDEYRIIINKKVDNSYSFPFKLFLDITDYCQLDCRHCLNNHHNSENKLDIKKIEKIIKECRDHGLFYVKLGGGEPLTHPNILKIIKEFSESGIYVSLSTNSLLINDSLSNFLKKYNVKVSISLEGPKEINDLIRGVGHYDIALRAIDTLIKNGCDPIIRVTLTRNMLDINNMQKMIDLAKEKNVRLKVSYCRPAGNALDNGLLIDYSDYKEYYNVISLLNEKEYESFVILDEGMQFRQDPELEKILYNDKICGAANRSMHINPSGKISPCIFLGEDFYEKESNYQYGDILRYWSNELGTKMKQIREIQIPDYCKECSRLCKLECSSTKYYFNKNFEKQDPNCLKGVVKCLKLK